MNKINTKLHSYIEALFPIIYINHFDFNEVENLIKEVANGRKPLIFNHGIDHNELTNQTLEGFLEEALELEVDRFIILRDLTEEELHSPVNIALLKAIANRTLTESDYIFPIFIVSNKLIIPRELEELITIFDIPYPEKEQIIEIMNNFIKSLDIRNVSEDTIDELASSLKGLNRFEIRQILNLAYQNGGTIDIKSKELIYDQKEQLMKKSGLLEIIKVSENKDDIGGLENLMEWLERKEKVISNLYEARKNGVDTPKGILLVGMPGCGKSLVSKATANIFNLPLVRLDIGRLMGKYVGESEDNMRRALKLAESTSPCVLWIDEVEKAFSGIGSSGGAGDVTTRLFGQFLTWMQENKSTVFIVATANKIKNIPAEFLRKGRFDELFFVDFPNEKERRKIFEIHLKKRGKKLRNINLDEIVKKTKGCNGADIEAVVKDAIETWYIEKGETFDERYLLDSKKKIKSISENLEKHIKALKEEISQLSLIPASR